MVFSSITFLYYFLPITIILYVLAPRSWRNYVLLGVSLVFYGWGEPKYLLLMGISIIVNYIMGLLIARDEGTVRAKLWLWVSILYSIGMLGYFKYTDFLIDNINNVFGTSISFMKIILPIGISFYTFQILSYTIDVYLKKTKAQKNIFYLATYVAFFPQLIAGPIVRYTDVVEALDNRSHSFEQIHMGLRRFCIGLMKKVLLANSFGEMCKVLITGDQRSVLFYWLYGIGFSLQIYFDFSGYSDMAIGLGKFFGFEFLENFHYPFTSKSITEFWRRWHISLGSWFRDYVYIPLGGNRVSKGKWLLNIFVVWFLTGLWHGAAWNFVLWGLYFAILLSLEKLWLKKQLKKLPKVVNHIYVLLMVLISFILFDASSIRIAWERIGGLFGWGNISTTDVLSLYQLRSYGFILLIGVLASTSLPKKVVKFISGIKHGKLLICVMEPLYFLACLLIASAYLVDASYNPFLYFRF